MVKEIWNEVFVGSFKDAFCTKKGWGRFFVTAPVVFLYVDNDYNLWLTLGLAMLMSWGIGWVTGDRDEG